MKMWASRFALAVAAVGLGFVAAQADPDLRDLQADEECPADGSGGEERALSLRQLRAKGVDGAATAAAVTDTTEKASAAPAPSPAFVGVPASPVAQPIPGGWGEAADYAHAIDPAGALNYSLKAQWGWAPAPSWTPSSGRRRYHHSNVRTLYHQTSQHAANLIMAGGFKPGRGGWCGGAIYFATTKRATYTKAIGPDSHKGAMLECKVDVGRVEYLNSRCSGSPHNEYNLEKRGYNSVSFNPGDGSEYILWDSSKVLSIKQVSKY